MVGQTFLSAFFLYFRRNADWDGRFDLYPRPLKSGERVDGRREMMSPRLHDIVMAWRRDLAVTQTYPPACRRITGRQDPFLKERAKRVT